jgi:hypothetical protein
VHTLNQYVGANKDWFVIHNFTLTSNKPFELLDTERPNRYTIYYSLIAPLNNETKKISFHPQKYLHHDFVMIWQFPAKQFLKIGKVCNWGLYIVLTYLLL